MADSLDGRFIGWQEKAGWQQWSYGRRKSHGQDVGKKSKRGQISKSQTRMQVASQQINRKEIIIKNLPYKGTNSVPKTR